MKKIKKMLRMEKDFPDVDEETRRDWNIITHPITLMKKTMRPDKSVRAFFPELRRRKKVAVVLSGGGAKGLAHVGFLRELEKYDVEIDFIAGTSMGAIVGALYALEKDLSIIDKHLKYKTRDLVTFKDITFSLKGMFKGMVIEDMLKDLYGKATFEDTKIPLVINAVDLETGKEKVFKEGKLIDAVRASMSIPVIFTPHKIKGKMYVDGGVMNNVPCNHVPGKYRKVVVCNVNSKMPPLKKNYTGIEFFLHTMSLLQHNATRIPRDDKHILVEPDMSKMSVGDFSKMREAIKIGEKKASETLGKHFKKIKEF